MTETARVRIGKVRLKNGPVILRLPTHNERRTKMAQEWVKCVLDAHVTADASVDGFAFVVWDRDGASTCKMIAGGGIPSILIPDFVRNKLLADKIEDWTLMTISERG